MKFSFRWQGYVLILLASFFWGTSGTAQTFAPGAANPPVIGALRVGIGGTALLFYALLKGKLPPQKRLPYGRTLMAAAAMAAYQIFFFSAVALTGVAVATVVTMGSSPIIAGLLSWLIEDEKPEKTWYIATAAAVAGCSLLLIPEAETVIVPAGIVLSLGGGAVYAVYALVSKKVLADHPPETLLGLAGPLSGIILLPVFIFSGPEWVMQSQGLQVSLYLGLISMALPYMLFNMGLIMVPVASAMTLTLAEPVTAALLGIFLVGERLAFLNYLGLILILIGIALLTVKGKESV